MPQEMNPTIIGSNSEVKETDNNRQNNLNRNDPNQNISVES